MANLASFSTLIAFSCGFITFDQIVPIWVNAASAEVEDHKQLASDSASASTKHSESSAAPNIGTVAVTNPRSAVAGGPPVTEADQTVTSNRRPLKVNIGDQLKIAVYERLEIDEDRWGRASDRVKAPSMSLQMRSEFTGDYSVQEDGTVSFPLLGTFNAAERSLEDLQNDLAATYEKMLGRPGIVNIRLAERPPVYVLGPVKNSGVYKFTAGMTVWHAVALAGGFDRNERSPGENLSNRLEATREIGNVQRSASRVASLMARRAILIAEREKHFVTTPTELFELVGRDKAAALIAEEASARALETAVLQARVTGIHAAIESARSEVHASRQRTSLIELGIKGHDERLNLLRTLSSQGLVKRPQVLEAEIQLTQAQERREESRIGASQAEQKIAQSDQELAKVNSDTDLEVGRQISAIDHELAELKSQRNVGLHILEALKNSLAAAIPTPSEIEASVQYEITRRSGAQTITIIAKGDTELQPGDLVKLTIVAPAERAQ